MSRFVTIPLGKLPTIFKRIGFSSNETIAALIGFIHLWRANHHYDALTIEFLLPELGLDPLAEQMLLMEGGYYLTELGNYIKQYAAGGQLIRWDVLPYVILLEIEDDREVFNTHGESASADGCPGTGGTVPFPF
jgi:hypothetical protein